MNSKHEDDRVRVAFTLWGTQKRRSWSVVQEAVTLLGNWGTKSLSGLNSFHVG